MEKLSLASPDGPLWMVSKCPVMFSKSPSLLVPLLSTPFNPTNNRVDTISGPQKDRIMWGEVYWGEGGFGVITSKTSKYDEVMTQKSLYFQVF